MNERENYVELDENRIRQDVKLLNDISKYQEECGEMDTDKIINQARDAMVGRVLGFKYVDLNKNGWDCASEWDRALEVKSINTNAKGWSATFNDTSMKKAEMFGRPDVYLAAAIWGKADELLGVVVGNSPELSEYLKMRVQKFLDGNAGIRSTQSISVGTLIKKYGFDIVAVDRTPEEFHQILKAKYPKLKIDVNNISTVEEYID